MAMRKASALAFAAAAALVIGAAGAQALRTGAPYHVSVSGDEEAAQLRSGTSNQVGSVVQGRGSTSGGKDAMSDTRVSGRFTSLLDQDEYPSGRIDFWVSRHVLKNAQGSWTGPGFGFRDAAGSHYIFSTNVGSGAYRGLVYHLVVMDYRSGTAVEHTFELFGWIEKGPAKIVPTVSRDHVKAGGRDVTRLEARGTIKKVGDAMYVAGATWTGTSKASTARLSGTVRVVLDTMSYPGGREDAWGTYTLTNSSGAWQGDVRGVRTPDGRLVRFVIATGSGAYRGLRYRAVLRASGTVGATALTWGVNGWIEPAK